MAIGDEAAAAGYPLVPGSTSPDGNVRNGYIEINRTRDFIAAVKALIPTSKSGYRTASGIAKGKFNVSFTSDSQRTGSQGFGVSLTGASVVLTPEADTLEVAVVLMSVSSSGFSYRVFETNNATVSGTVTIHWVAVGG